MKKKEKTPYRLFATVIEIQPDYGIDDAEFTKVSIGVPAPSVPSRYAYHVYKHIVHLFIPKAEWHGQFQFWDKVVVIISQGKLVVEKVEEGSK